MTFQKEITVYDITGMLSIYHTGTGQTQQITLNNLLNGTYIIKVVTAKNSYTQKVVLNK